MRTDGDFEFLGVFIKEKKREEKIRKGSHRLKIYN